MITDKIWVEHAHKPVIRRLPARSRQRDAVDLQLCSAGSGSFGHVAAKNTARAKE
jgi:isopentenyl phosphate kinase